VPLDVRTETVRVSGDGERTVTIRSTRHGPLISDPSEDIAEVGDFAPTPRGTPDSARGEGYAIALRWTALEPSRTADAIFMLNIAANWEEPQGVPISGVIFGSRRTGVIPLVFEAFDWSHGVFLGSAMSTETTAAITGKVGVVRRDPMAMIPFCGYNMADYFDHWLATGPRLAKPPRIFRVNWFRRDADGRFLWPGYGENVRVLKWMVERIRGTARAEETPIGWVPAAGALDTDGLDVTPAQLREALRCDAGEWLQGLDELGEFYKQFGSRLPAPIAEALAWTRRRFGG